MGNSKKKRESDTGIWETFKSDFKSEGLKDDIKYDFTETLEFYLTDEQKQRLKEMGWFKKIFFIPAWLLRVLFFKLTRIRRLLLVLAIVLYVISGNIIISDNVRSDSNTTFFSVLILLFILILELKDKLIARDELSAGRAVQTAFMPPQNPNIPGWSLWLYSRPANSVGGDMVDLIKIDKNNFGIALGDVSGKELGAALYMVKLQSTLRALVSDSESLAELGSKINSIFFRDSEPNRFATMIYFGLSKGSGNIKILNAGHIPPLTLSGGKITELEKGSAAIGIKKKSNYREQQLVLKKGDLIISYSDGVTEAVNQSGEFFGAERLKQILKANKYLSPEEMGKVILNHVKDFSGKCRLFDDLSIIIIKYEGN
ncbi:MAG: PP2C family protein-serine/threonine phosphatase [Acidobacteriota bacterium]